MKDVKIKTKCPTCSGRGFLDVKRRKALGLLNGEFQVLSDVTKKGELGPILELGRIAQRHLSPKAISLEREYARVNGRLLDMSKTLLREREADVRFDSKKEGQRRTQLLLEVEKKQEQLEKRRRDIEAERLRETKQLRETMDSISRAIVTPKGSGNVGEIVTIKDLKTACPVDDFSDQKSDRKGVDIAATVNDKESEAGSVVVSVKYRRKWEGAFLDQIRRNMADEGADYGVLVTQVFPSDSLNDRVYFRGPILVVKPPYAAIAYLAIREVVLLARHHKQRLSKEVDRLAVEEKLLSVVQEWVAGDKVTQVTSFIEAGIQSSNATDDAVERWVTYARTTGDQVKRKQTELRGNLMKGLGLIKDLRDQLHAKVEDHAT